MVVWIEPVSGGTVEFVRKEGDGDTAGNDHELNDASIES